MPITISSWQEFQYIFLRYWGEHKYNEKYLSKLYAMCQRSNKLVGVFNRRFQKFYFSIRKEILPPDAPVMVYYLANLPPYVAFYLREKGSKTTEKMFIDAQEIEDNLWASGKLLGQDLHLDSKKKLTGEGIQTEIIGFEH